MHRSWLALTSRTLHIRPTAEHFWHSVPARRPLSRLQGGPAGMVTEQGQVAGAATSPQLLSVAPMMDWTDLHYRQLARLLSRHTWLYTEMVVDSTLLHNPDHDRFLWHPPEQRPLVCQLGGSDPERLAAAARIVQSYGYDEINLNVGCPSDRVAGAGCFGAALMLDPQLVADCCSAMAAAVDIPITVKCRLGVDDQDSYDQLVRFVHTVSTRSPVRHFIIHARKAHLKGLNPHQNRTIPPLRYGWVWALKRDFPGLIFSLNGGVQGLDAAGAAIRVSGSPLQGVMVGRAAYHAPWDTLASADVRVFGVAENAALSRRAVLDAYAEYCDGVQARFAGAPGPGPRPTPGWKGPSLRVLFKPLLGMFAGEPRGRQWRAAVDAAFKAGLGSVRAILDATLPVLLPETLDAPPKPDDAASDEQRLASMDAEQLRDVLMHWDPDFPPTPAWLPAQGAADAGAHHANSAEDRKPSNDAGLDISDVGVSDSAAPLRREQAAEIECRAAAGEAQAAAQRDAMCSPAAEEIEADERDAVAESPIARCERQGTVDIQDPDGTGVSGPPPCKKARETDVGGRIEDWEMVEHAARVHK